MNLMSFVLGLFKRKKSPDYTADDVRSASLSCGHMDYSFCYSFFLRKKDNIWLLDADYAENTEAARTEYEDRKTDDTDVEKLLCIIRDNDLIKKMQLYRKPKKRIVIQDETTYTTGLCFTDGKTLCVPTLISKDFETEFRHLAEKYKNPPT